jgi:hypothetical protein
MDLSYERDLVEVDDVVLWVFVFGYIVEDN